MNYYNILGVNKNSSINEIKKSYKDLALKYHPDRNNEPGAEEQFKKIAESYAILSDESKRKTYDLGFDPNNNVFGNIDAFNIFENFFENIDVNNLVDNFFKNQSMDAFSGKYDDILGGPEVKFSIHNFTEFPSGKFTKEGGILFDEHVNFSELINKSNEKMKDLREHFSKFKVENNNIINENQNEKRNYRLKLDNLKEENRKLKEENKNLRNNLKLLDKPKDIILNIGINIEDLLIEKKKKIKYKIYENNLKEIKNLEKKKIVKFNKKEIILNNEGNIDLRYNYNGDVKIKVNIKSNKIIYFNKNNIDCLLFNIDINKFDKDIENTYIKFEYLKNIVFKIDKIDKIDANYILEYNTNHIYLKNIKVYIKLIDKYENNIDFESLNKPDNFLEGDKINFNTIFE